MPAAIPQVVPVPDTVAIVGSELIQAPPPVVLLSVTQLPIHTDAGPVIVDGKPFTVSTAVVVQFVVAVNVIVVVPVPDTPVANPVASIVATVGSLLAHVPPPDVLLLNAVVLPWHTLSVPPIVDGIPLTVTTWVVIQPLGTV